MPTPAEVLADPNVFRFYAVAPRFGNFNDWVLIDSAMRSQADEARRLFAKYAEHYTFVRVYLGDDMIGSSGERGRAVEWKLR